MASEHLQGGGTGMGAGARRGGSRQGARGGHPAGEGAGCIGQASADRATAWHAGPGGSGELSPFLVNTRGGYETRTKRSGIVTAPRPGTGAHKAPRDTRAHKHTGDTQRAAREPKGQIVLAWCGC
jgi:hypothetical protein